MARSFGPGGGGESSGSRENPLRDRAKDIARRARDLLQDRAQDMVQQQGMLLVCVETAKIICSETIPARTINQLLVPEPRSRVEGKKLAQVQDVKRDHNIMPWSCKCRKRPSAGGYLPCDYQPQGMWTPGVQTGTNDAMNPGSGGGAGAPHMQLIPEVAVHRCTYGGVISIVDPAQRTQRAKLGDASMSPDGQLLAMGRGQAAGMAAGVAVGAMNALGGGGLLGVAEALNLDSFASTVPMSGAPALVQPGAPIIRRP